MMSLPLIGFVALVAADVVGSIKTQRFLMP
jgi:hypothetical protein